jgi:hypothetical protein
MVLPNLFHRDSKMDTSSVPEPEVMPIHALHSSMKDAHDSLLHRLKVVQAEQRRLQELEFELTTALNSITAGAKVLADARKVETEVQIQVEDIEQV